VHNLLIRVVRSALRRFFEASGNKYFLDPESWKIIRCQFDGMDFIHTWKGGALVWFEPTVQAIHITSEDLPLFLKHAKLLSGDKVLIAGAGMGSEIWYFSQIVGPQGLVIAIEPDDDAFRRLSKLVELLPFENVKILKCAVTAKTGKAFLYSPDSTTVSNTIVKVIDSELQPQTIDTETIENICKTLGLCEIDYLKMNIEGAEYSALLGIGSVNVKHFCISCHDFLGENFRTKQPVLKRLLKQGYIVWENEEEPLKPWVGSYVYAKMPSVG